MGGTRQFMGRNCQALCPVSARKVADGHNFDHCPGRPAARWRRWLLRVQPVWWGWAWRRSGRVTDYSPLALVLRRPAYQPPLIWKTGAAVRGARPFLTKTGALTDASRQSRF